MRLSTLSLSVSGWYHTQQKSFIPIGLPLLVLVFAVPTDSHIVCTVVSTSVHKHRMYYLHHHH